MRYDKSIFLAISLFMVAFSTSVMATPMPCETNLAKSAIPKNIAFLSESQATKLQEALNIFRSVRLKPGGNYRSSPPVKLTSNQSLYGLAGTKLPKIIVVEGTRNAILSGVSPVNISFEGSTKLIQKNCFNRISDSKIIANNVMMSDNLFTDLSNVAVISDTSQAGYLKNNRFIRTMVHAAYPAININGNIDKQSQGNTFVWTNVLTPHGDGIIINNQKNIRFVGIDAESWNWSQIATYPGMMNVQNTNFLSMFMANGGDNKNKNGQYFNLDATNILLQSTRIGRTQKPGIILGDSVENMVTIDTRDIGLDQLRPSTQVIDIDKDAKKLITINAQNIQPENITNATKNTISTLMEIDKAHYATWQQPAFELPPNPAGANWAANLASKPDSADKIQSLIDKNGIAELGAGIYYISKPLLLKSGQGVIGAGDDKTVIIAKSPGIDLIVGANHFDANTVATAFTLADLTLQGGLNGINDSATGAGQSAQYNKITLSHVTIRNMSNAGILLDKIYAWDNNFIDYVNFYRCKTGVKQRPDPTYVGGDKPGMTYMDKNVFYQNQFIENGIAIDMQAKRANNLNAFINCQFKDNEQDLIIQNSNSTFFANSIFKSTSKLPLLTGNSLTGFVNSSFFGKQPGVPLFNAGVYCNNCRFDNRLINTSVIVAPTARNSFFVNDTLSLAINQPLDTGVIVNSNFTSDPTTPRINSLFVNKIAKPF